MSISRLSYSMGNAAAITLALLSIMSYLISQTDIPDLKPISQPNISFLPAQDFDADPKPIDRRPKLDKIELPPTPQKPDWQKIEVTEGGSGGAFKPPIDTPVPGESLSGPGLMPLVKISPEYPTRAAAAGIEGYVVVEYTVTRLGLVINPKVIESYPHGYFEKSALRAIQRFRYNPQQVDGVAVDMQGVRQKFTFELESTKQG